MSSAPLARTCGARSSGVDHEIRLRSWVAIAPPAECCASRPKFHHAGPSTGAAGGTCGPPDVPALPPPPPQPTSAAMQHSKAERATLRPIERSELDAGRQAMRTDSRAEE